MKNMNQALTLKNDIHTYLAEVGRFPLLSQEEEKEYTRRYFETGDTEAAHKLVTSNLRFVVKIAYEYASYGLRMSDLIQEGNIGLMHAVKKFDPQKGVRLISYAVWWIRAHIQTFILKNWSLVKIGTTQAQRKLFYKLGQVKKHLVLLSSGGQWADASVTSVANALNVKEEEVVEMDQRLKARDASMDQQISGTENMTLLDKLESPENQETLLIQNEEQQRTYLKVHSALNVLNDREKYIVEKRIMAEHPATLHEIGEHYGISRERARQLESRAKEKLRQALLAA